MTVEVVAAALVGLAAVWLILQPLVGASPVRPSVYEPPEPEDTPRGMALAALKEIEFDRETGKLSDEDYAFLKRKYTAAALAALREDADEAPAAERDEDVELLIAARVRAIRSTASSALPGMPACPTCGPRPEADAAFCSTCGGRVGDGGACSSCGVPLEPGSRFCAACGTAAAA